MPATEQATWTPGPWGLNEHGFSSRPPFNRPTVYATDDELRYIAFVGDLNHLNMRDTPDLANARLIAAAPDIYNAAVFARSVIREHGIGEGIDAGPVLAELDVAIAQAEGRE